MRALRLHVWLYGAGVAALGGVNWLAGGHWWSFWPLAAWGVALAAHYLVFKSRTADERWAQERAADLRSKSYDASHMDSIAERYKVDAQAPPERPE